MQRTVLHEDGRNRAAALIEARLNDGALCGTVRVRLELLHFRNEQNHFKEIIDTHFGVCGNRDARHVAAPLFRHELVFGELLLDEIRVCGRFIHFVDGNDDGNARCLSVVDGFYRLRHDAVIGCDDQHGDIRNHSASCTHGGEGGVTRRIKERNVLAVDIDAVCADVLRDAAGFARGNVCVADGVQNGGLAVVNVAHDNDDRCARHKVCIVVFAVVNDAVFDGDDDLFFNLCVELIGNEYGGIKIDGVVDGSENAVCHELLDDFGARCLQAEGKLADGNLIRHGDGDGLRLAFCRDAVESFRFRLALCAARLAAALALLVDLLLCGNGVVLHLVVRQTVVLFVVLVDVDVDRSGIDHAAARSFACGLLCRSVVARLVVLRRTLRLILLCVLVSVIAVIVAAIVIFVAIIIVIHVLLLRLLRVLSGFFARFFRCFLGRLLFGLCRIARCKVRVKVLCGMILREAVKNDIELVFF